MKIGDLSVGRTYALREKRSRTAPIVKVRVVDIAHDKKQVRIRFEEGDHPGLEQYVAPGLLVARWNQRKAVLRDDEKAARLTAHARKVKDRALMEAASAVLESTGERGAGVNSDGTCWSRGPELRRILDRAGITDSPTTLHPLAYRSRDGRTWLPLEALVTIAKSFAAAEPLTVVGYLDDQEEELRLLGNQPGERWHHDFLRELRPGYAVARQWAGVEQEAEMLRKEIARLRAIVSVAINTLEAAGEERTASRLLRALEGR